MPNIGRDEIVDALKEMDETEARQIFNEARGRDAKTRQTRATNALKQFIGGTPRKESE